MNHNILRHGKRPGLGWTMASLKSKCLELVYLVINRKKLP